MPSDRNRQGKVRLAVLCAGVIGAVGLAVFASGHGQALAQMTGQMHGGMHGHGAMHGHGGMGHDEYTMPGLRGLNATEEESAELAVLFRNFQTLSREVTLLPNGIRTVTRSSDPEVMEALVSHTTGMIARVDRGDDPQIMIQSPTLDIFFERGADMTSEFSVTEEGIVVLRTSTDPEIVAALHTHAEEVSDMVARGMHAVHERMMTQGSD